MPAREAAVAALNPGIAGRVVAEQNVRRIAAEVVPDTDNRIGGVGAADLNSWSLIAPDFLS